MGIPTLEVFLPFSMQAENSAAEDTKYPEAFTV